ncbi:hypothetical protein HYX58_02860 [Candidatus Dependentiae bacterium]|nr:hypothetical protein [Candidatus Dependentiae bacterium]
MKKAAFVVLVVSLLAHAEPQDTILSSASSWLANHKLGIAGIGLIGGGLLAKRIIREIENKRLHQYMLNNPVNAKNMKKDGICSLINEKIQKGFLWNWGLGKDNNNVIVTFQKITPLGKQLKDKIDLNASGRTITLFTPIEDGDGLNKIEIDCIDDNLIVTNLGRELKHVAYADWVQNAFTGIGAIALLKSAIFD